MLQKRQLLTDFFHLIQIQLHDLNSRFLVHLHEDFSPGICGNGMPPGMISCVHVPGWCGSDGVAILSWRRVESACSVMKMITTVIMKIP